MKLAELQEKASWVWKETLKIHKRSPETRVASSLSPVEIFVALYYSGILLFKPEEPYWEARDRCIISKGHGSLCMYPILADLGFFDPSELESICKAGSFLGGIPDPIIPGYETINGSLGHGAGVGAGVAKALKTKGSKSKVYVVVGDGELHEGANWEAFMFATQHQLDNLTVIVDNNAICMLGQTEDVVSHLDLKKKLEAFGWFVVNASDGHNMQCLLEAFDLVKSDQQKRPKIIIANTKKGRGVPGLEGADLSHVTAINPDQIDMLISEKF